MTIFYPIQPILLPYVLSFTPFTPFLFKSFATKTESATQKTKQSLVYLCTAYKLTSIKVLLREDLKILNIAFESLQLFFVFYVYDIIQIISGCSEHSVKSKNKTIFLEKMFSRFNTFFFSPQVKLNWIIIPRK